LPDTQKKRLAAAADERKPARQKARQREQEGKVVPQAAVQKSKIARPISPTRPANTPPPVAPAVSQPAVAPVATVPTPQAGPAALQPAGSRAD
jgi:hypothetical protein